MKYYKNFALNIAPEPFYPRKYAISHFDDSSAIQRSKCLQQPLPSDVTFKQPKRCVHGFTYKTKTHYCSNSIHNTSVTNIHTHARTLRDRPPKENARIRCFSKWAKAKYNNTKRTSFIIFCLEPQKPTSAPNFTTMNLIRCVSGCVLLVYLRKNVFRKCTMHSETLQVRGLLVARLKRGLNSSLRSNNDS